MKPKALVKVDYKNLGEFLDKLSYEYGAHCLTRFYSNPSMEVYSLYEFPNQDMLIEYALVHGDIITNWEDLPLSIPSAELITKI